MNDTEESSWTCRYRMLCILIPVDTDVRIQREKEKEKKNHQKSESEFSVLSFSHLKYNKIKKRARKGVHGMIINLEDRTGQEDMQP